MNEINKRVTGYLLMVRGDDWDQRIGDGELKNMVDRTTIISSLVESGMRGAERRRW